MKKVALLLSLLAINAFALDAKTKLRSSDVKLIESLDKVELLRVYASKKVKSKYKHVIKDQTDVNADISSVNKKEIIKKVVKKNVKGKIIAIDRDFYDDTLVGVHVSFDKACTSKAQECSYFFKRMFDKDVFKLVSVPKKLAIGEEIKKDFELEPSNFRNAVLKVIKKEIDEVKKDTVQSQGW